MIAKKKKSRRRNRPPQKRPRWSSEDLKLFVRLHPKMPNPAIARRLGRPIQGITSKAHKMGLRKNHQRLVNMGKENIAHRWGKKRRTRRKA
jgi:hypothetical protein